MSLTTEQMQTALANAGLTKNTKPASDFSLADVVASIGSGTIAAAENTTANISGFFTRVKICYAFKRAVRKGLIPDSNPNTDTEPKVIARSRRTQTN